MKSSFQDGVNTLYNKCVSCGVTPTAKTPAAIANAIQSISNSASGKWRISFYGNFHDNSSPVKWFKLTDQVTIQVNSNGTVTVVANESFLNGQISADFGGGYSITKV